MSTTTGIIAALGLIVFTLVFFLMVLFSDTGAKGVLSNKQSLLGLGLILVGTLLSVALAVVVFQDLSKLGQADAVLWIQKIYSSIFNPDVQPPTLLP